MQLDDRWNPIHFAPIYQSESSGQLIIFPIAVTEPPDPDDYLALEKYEMAWQKWEVIASSTPRSNTP